MKSNGVDLFDFFYFNKKGINLINYIKLAKFIIINTMKHSFS